jgi:hypothetical protein
VTKLIWYVLHTETLDHGKRKEKEKEKNKQQKLARIPSLISNSGQHFDIYAFEVFYTCM